MRLEDSVIASSGSNGTAVSLEAVDSFTMTAPAALTGVVTLQQSPDDGTNWFDITSAGVVVTIGAGETVTCIKLHGSHVRAQSAASEAAERTFTVHGSGPKQI